MVSRSETARQLLTPGEVMQLPPTDEIVMVAGTPPIRAKKARYYEMPASRNASCRRRGWRGLLKVGRRLEQAADPRAPGHGENSRADDERRG
jgi:type IV secretory pathway TraG/TraD family ATPase VirD4